MFGLLDDYGPGAPLAERYCEYHSSLFLLAFPNLYRQLRLGWFGAVGTVVGLVCGFALLGLPVAVAGLILYLT